MKKILKYTAAFIVSFLIGMGIARVSKAQESSLLWKVSGNELTSPSYLYGTIHVACPDQIVIKDRVRNAISATSKVIFELDMDDPSLMADMQKYSISPDMKNIKEDLTEEQASDLNDELTRSLGVGLDQLGVLKPFAIYSAIMSTLPPCEQAFSFEEAIMKVAAESGLEIEGLESVSQQFSFIDQVPRSEQVSWITSMIEDPEKYASDFNELLEAYLDEDLKRLHHLTVSNPEFSSLVDLLIYERNQAWIPEISNAMNEGATFFAVGAAHLGSDQGLISLLRKEGYRVEAIMN